MDRSFLDNHYDSILTANREIILAGGVGDALLERALTDSRMSLVVLIRISLNVAEKINSCIDDLRGIEPNLYYYPAKDFHITVMDVLKGEEGRRIPPNITEYIRCIEECSKEISPFKIRFDGLTASDNAILVRGYYDDLSRGGFHWRRDTKPFRLMSQLQDCTVSIKIPRSFWIT